MPDPTPTATDRETEARAIACPEYGCGAKHRYGCDRLTERLIRLIAAAEARGRTAERAECVEIADAAESQAFNSYMTAKGAALRRVRREVRNAIHGVAESIRLRDGVARDQASRATAGAPEAKNG